MANIIWPQYAIPSRFQIRRFTKTNRALALFGHSGQNIDLVNDRWEVEMSIAPRNPQIGSKIEALINYMRGGANTVELYHFFRRSPLGTIIGTPVLASEAPQGSSMLSIQAVAGETLCAGDMIGVSGLLFQVAVDCEANGSGLLETPIVGRVRQTLPDASMVTLQQPSTRFRLSQEGASTIGRGGHLMSLDLSFVEAVQ